MSDSVDTRYYLGFSLAPNIGPARLGRLIEVFGTVERAWLASGSELIGIGFESRLTESLISTRARLDLDRELEKVKRHGATIITQADPSYPERLKETYGAPMLLYVMGDIQPQDDLALAVVGTRRVSAYGRQVTETITREIAERGITIVSGLARGVDTIAHKAALSASGRTIAVLGCGLDVVYPPENAALYKDIPKRGAIISEYPLGSPPGASNFPARNRIVSGLSRGILITEAPKNSGALITARFAAEQGRDVFAVPGNIFSPLAFGVNMLIQEGAKLVMSSSDILDELLPEEAHEQLVMREMMPADEDERAVMALLSAADARHIDDICREGDFEAGSLSARLTLLELKGLIQHVGGMRYRLSR